MTGLVLIGSTAVSVSIDATIRQWSLKPDELQLAVEKAKNPTEDVEGKPNPESMLTEEEERELAELLDE